MKHTGNSDCGRRFQEKKFLLGVNYWPRKSGVKMWRDFDEKEIDAEFAQIRELGMDTVRVFPLWDDFQPIYELPNAQIIDSGSLLGCREGRRILGDYVLTRKDFDARRDFPDEIGRYNFAADIHPSHPGRTAIEEHKKHFHESCMKRGESYGIPYRILLPRNVKNLLTCGRCVSCDRDVFASIRVIPGCYITGQAAGIASAIALENGNDDPRKIHIPDLRSKLMHLGVYMH